MSNDTPIKVCSKCSQEFPATTEYFYVKKSVKDGLTGRCRACIQADGYEYYQANRDKKLEYSRKYRQANLDKMREKDRKYHQANQDKRREYNRKYRQANRDKLVKGKRLYYQANQTRLRESKREYQQANRDKINERNREYQQANRGKLLKEKRLYYQANRDKILEYHRANPELNRIRKARRNARKRSLPDTFTSEQWQACLEYFHYCCAACGAQLRDLFGNVVPHADHWIPLSSDECPGTTADNMVCLCSECNLSKNAKHPEQWLIEKFGKRKAALILERVNAYFEWTRTPK